MNEPRDIEHLVKQCKKGDADAFSQLIECYSKRLYAYFYRLTGRPHVSEELLSDLFIRLVNKIHSFQGGSFEKWLFTVASNLFKDYLRQQYREKRFLEKRAEQLLTAERSMNQENLALDTLQLALEKLDSETSELITLRYYGDLSFKELAEMRDEPIGTTLSKVHRSIKKLRHIMETL